MPAKDKNSNQTPVQNNGDLAPVTFIDSALSSSNSIHLDFPFKIQPMNNKMDKTRAVTSGIKVFTTNHTPPSVGATTIPRLL